jgi:hypothetical protein
MSEAWPPQDVLRTLAECQKRLDELGAELAAAHLDSAIHALCEQFSLSTDVKSSSQL